MSSLDSLAGPAVADAVALYSARSGPAVRAILRRGYAEDATFDDGAVSVKGHPDMLVQFTALKIFPQVSVALRTSSGQQQNTQQQNTQQNTQQQLQQQQPAYEVKTSSPGKALVSFRNTQSFSLPFSLTTVTLVVDTELELDARSGKIERHVDRWRSVSVGGGALCLPAPTMPRLLRWGLGKSTSLAMRLAGVGTGGGVGVAGGGGGSAASGSGGGTKAD